METPFAGDQKPQEHIVLIVDRKNIFGTTLIKQLAKHATVVLVSEVKPEDVSCIHVPFAKRVPQIPEGVYSHVFVVSDEDTEHELLVPLAQKAQEDNAKFVYVLPYWLYTKEVVEKISSLVKRWVVVFLGDLFGKEGRTTRIDALLSEGKKHQTIHLPDLGLQTLRPIAYKDAQEALLWIGFGLDRDHICFLLPKHTYTELSLAHALQKIDPMLHIDFSTKEAGVLKPTLPEGSYMLEAEYPVLKKIQDSYNEIKVDKKIAFSSAEEVRKVSGKKNTVNWKLPVFSMLAGVMFLLILPILWTYTTFGFGLLFLSGVTREVAKGNWQQAETDAKIGNNFFTSANVASRIMSWEASFVGQEGSVASLTSSLQAQQQLSQVVILGINGVGSLQEVAQGKTITPDLTFANGISAIKNALLLLQEVNQKDLPSPVTLVLRQFTPFFGLLGQTIDIFADLAGIHTPKTYLILLQDNMELRPGGGAIAVYGVAKLTKGKLDKLEMHNINDADGQLKGHVDPPFAIRRFVPLAHWYLRDSNFAADNTKNAQAAAFFLQQETGVKADGVINIDLYFVQAVIGSVGGVYVPEYKLTVNKDNFFQLVKTFAEKSNTTANQKKDFLTALVQALQNKLQAGNVSYTDFFLQVMSAIKEKHLLFAFASPSIQQVFTVNNMSSSLWDPRTPQENTLNDFVGISEANIGLNKDNAFLKRNLLQEITMYPSGTISGVLTIHYANTSDGSWPGGVYKNYLRAILPSGAQISNIQINGVLQSRYPAVIDPKLYEATTFKAPEGLEIEHTQEQGRETYGFLVTVPTKSESVVTISYTLPQVLDLTKPQGSYDMLLFKQPGTDNDPYVFSLQYPPSIFITAAPKEALLTKGKIVLTNPFTADLDYHITFARQ